MNLNIALFAYLYSFAHQSVAQDNVIIFFAEILPYLVVLGAIIFLVTHKDKVPFYEKIKIFINHLFGRKTPEIWTRWKEVAFVFASSGCAWLVAISLQALFKVPRPFVVFDSVYSVFEQTGYGFPSGHATFFSALSVSIYLIHKKVGRWFLLCTLLICVARIVGGVHYPFDVLAGFLVGTSIGTGLYFLFKKSWE